MLVRQMPLNVRWTTVCPSSNNLLSNSQTFRQCYFHLLSQLTFKQSPHPRYISYGVITDNASLRLVNSECNGLTNRVNKVPKTFPEFYFSNMKLKREISKFCEMASSPGENVDTILQMLLYLIFRWGTN